MSISYGELKTLVTTANKAASNKSFAVIERKIQKGYQEQHKEEIKYLKQLIKKVVAEKDKPEDLVILIGPEELTKEEKKELLEDLLKEKQQFVIPSDFTIMKETLPKILQKLIIPSSSSSRRVRVSNQTTTPKKKENKKNILRRMRQEQERENEILAKQVISIEPMDFFVLLPFYALSDEQSNILSSMLDLDEDMMPNKYTIFETFNTIVEKKHLTGEYFEYNVKQSEISKKFLEMEPELQKTLFDFTKLNKRAIRKARDEMLELKAVIQILYDFENKDLSSFAKVVINNIIRIYNNLIKNSKNNPNIIKYLTRSIQLLERRRQKMEEELPEIIKNDDKRKFLTKETSQLIQQQPQTQPDQDVRQGDEELGEHYNDRFEEDEGFDDFDIVDEDDSDLLGGAHHKY
jgi:hypothetical protein